MSDNNQQQPQAQQPAHAQTGNPYIPGHPELQAQMAADLGHQAQQPAQQQDAGFQNQGEPGGDFDWLGVLDDAPQQQQPAPPAQPQAQPGQQQPSQTQPQGGQQAPVEQPGQQQPQQPGAPELSPEALEAIGRANLEGQQQPQQGQQQQPYDSASVEQQAIDHLTKNVYGLSEDQAKQLISEPESVLPGLAARMHVQITQQVGQMVGQLLPQLANQVVETKMKSMRAQQAFFRKYPHLSDPRFTGVVAQSLRLAAAAAEPGTTREQIMDMGATLAASKLKMQRQQQPSTQQQATPQQQAPQGNGQMPQQPFQPAVGSPGAPIPQPQLTSDEQVFAELAMDDDW